MPLSPSLSLSQKFLALAPSLSPPVLPRLNVLLSFSFPCLCLLRSLLHLFLFDLALSILASRYVALLLCLSNEYFMIAFLAHACAPPHDMSGGQGARLPGPLPQELHLLGGHGVL